MKIYMLGLVFIIFMMLSGLALPFLNTELTYIVKFYVVSSVVSLFLIYIGFIKKAPSSTKTLYQLTLERDSRIQKNRFFKYYNLICVMGSFLITGLAIGLISPGLKGWLVLLLSNDPWFDSKILENSPSQMRGKYPSKLFFESATGSNYNEWYSLHRDNVKEHKFEKGDRVCLKGYKGIFGIHISEEFRLLSGLGNQLYCNEQILFTKSNFKSFYSPVENFSKLFLGLVDEKSNDKILSMIYEDAVIFEYINNGNNIELLLGVNSNEYESLQDKLISIAKEKKYTIGNRNINNMSYTSITINDSFGEYRTRGFNGEIVVYDKIFYLYSLMHHWFNEMPQVDSEYEFETYLISD